MNTAESARGPALIQRLAPRKRRGFVVFGAAWAAVGLLAMVGAGVALRGGRRLGAVIALEAVFAAWVATGIFSVAVTRFRCEVEGAVLTSQRLGRRSADLSQVDAAWVTALRQQGGSEAWTLRLSGADLRATFLFRRRQGAPSLGTHPGLAGIRAVIAGLRINPDSGAVAPAVHALTLLLQIEERRVDPHHAEAELRSQVPAGGLPWSSRRRRPPPGDSPAIS